MTARFGLTARRPRTPRRAALTLGAVLLLVGCGSAPDEDMGVLSLGPTDEAAVLRAVENSTNWLLYRKYRNVLVEVNNETDVKAYHHEILKPARIHELIDLVKGMNRQGRRLLTGTSYGGNGIPRENVVKSSGYRPMPILFNEDDHFDFDKPQNNFMAALSEYASWGYFDPGASDYVDGYQCPPVNWGINSDRKKAFFHLLRDVTGA